MTAGGTLDKDAQSAAVGIGVRYSLRPSSAIIWNPVLGAQFLYLPPGGNREAHVAAAILEVGLRVQQPVKGFYVDVRGGGYAGFRTAEPADGDDGTTFQGGLTGSIGSGYRINDFEIGASVRGLKALTPTSRDHVMVLGVGAYRFKGL